MSRKGLQRNPNESLTLLYATKEKSPFFTFLNQKNNNFDWSISFKANILNAFLRSNISNFVSNLRCIKADDNF